MSFVRQIRRPERSIKLHPGPKSTIWRNSKVSPRMLRLRSGRRGGTSATGEQDRQTGIRLELTNCRLQITSVGRRQQAWGIDEKHNLRRRESARRAFAALSCVKQF